MAESSSAVFFTFSIWGAANAMMMSMMDMTMRSSMRVKPDSGSRRQAPVAGDFEVRDVVFMSCRYLSRLTAIEYRRFARAEDTVWNRDAVFRLRSIFGKEGKFFNVGKVAQASDLKLVFDEVGFGDE